VLFVAAAMAHFFGDAEAALSQERSGLYQIDQILPLYERSPKWLCEVESKFLCFDDVCRRFAVQDQSKPGGDKRPRYWMELDFDAHTYTRCDQNGCNTKDVGTSAAGAFTLIEPGDGAFMKIANADFEFVDVATMGTGVATSFGICMPLRD